MRKGQKMPEHLRLAMSERLKKNPTRYWLGKKRDPISNETRIKLSNSIKKAYKEGRRIVSDENKERIANLNKGRIGKEHPKWKVEKKRPLYHTIRNTFFYKNWRKEIFKRDNYTCQFCNKRGGDIEADHFPKMFIEIIRENCIDSIDRAIDCKELWEAQGRTLCKSCHRTTYRR